MNWVGALPSRGFYSSDGDKTNTQGKIRQGEKWQMPQQRYREGALGFRQRGGSC